MSTAALYHAFSIYGYPLKGLSFEAGILFIEVEVPDARLRCPACGCRVVIRRGAFERWIRHVPIGSKWSFVKVDVPRVECCECGAVRRVRLSFVAEGRTYTRAFEQYALALLRLMTIRDVALHLGTSWDTIKDIQKRYLQRRYGKVKLRGVTLIAIDEISIAKGHRYVTVVIDLLRGRVIYVGEGKGQEALDPFWKRLRWWKGKIRAVAIDMSRAYIEAVKKNLPKAVLVFDHFHVIKLFNERLSEYRRELQRAAETKEEKKTLKGTRWLLLKNPENLRSDRRERQRLRAVLRSNRPLMLAYLMKEDLRQVWKQPTKRAARKFLNGWIRRARVSGVAMLEKFADTLENHREGILGYYRYRISTGPLEGLNTKITVMKRMAYGFRDPRFFMLRILGIHETKWKLVG